MLVAASPPAAAAAALPLVDLTDSLSNHGALVRALRPPDQVRSVDPPRPVVRTVRRLSEDQIEDLVAGYCQGSSVNQLADRFGIHRTTVLGHLDRRKVPRRRNVTKLVGARLAEAIRLYESGLSLAAVGKEVDVNARTVATALHKAGVALRTRRGWPQTQPVSGPR